MLKVTGAVLVAGMAMATQAMAADAPAEIKIGTLYASSGRYASISIAGFQRSEALGRAEECRRRRLC